MSTEAYFDEKAASKATRFFEECLVHVEGEHAGKPFTLLPWQRKIVRDLFGWHKNGTRLYRQAYIEIPRKNGKSTICAGLALYLLLCDGESKPQVYSAAGDRLQARIVFEAARDMIQRSSILRKKALVFQHSIENLKYGGYYKALSSEAFSKHGFNASGIIFDELHVQRDRQLWDVLTTSTGARKQPLTIAITTAGHDRSSICWELHQRAVSALANPKSDPAFYPVIFGADQDDDWTSEAVWAKANPSLGATLKLEYLQQKCDEAKKNPAAENTFRNLHLNQWTEQAVRWLPMADWDACRVEAENYYQGEPCWAGLDLASTRDVNSLVLLWKSDEDKYRIMPFYWTPEDARDERGKSDRTQVKNWAGQGLIRTTPGNVTDYATVATDIAEICEQYNVQEIAYDPWGPTRAFAQQLTANGFDATKLVEYRQTIGNFAAPSKEFERLIVSRRLEHNGCPVLRWMAGNVAVWQDTSGNIRPDKGKSQDKIDGIVAAIMALGRVLLQEREQSWYYETNGVEIG